MKPCLALVAVVCAVSGCNKMTAKKESAAAASPVAAALVGNTWTGKLDKTVMQMSFSSTGTAVTGEIRYTVFGSVRSRDKLTVTVDDQSIVHLKPSGTANVLVGGKGTGINELRGQLSPDKTTLSGSLPGTNGTTEWSVSTVAKLADLDPPIDLAAAEKALLSGKWEGKLGPRPAKLTVTKKAGRLTAKIAADRSASTFQLELDNTGRFTIKAPPRPTAQGLLTETGRGYFLNPDLKRLRGSISTSVKQGFIEQSGDTAWSFDNLRK
jgi:hypothetical protein